MDTVVAEMVAQWGIFGIIFLGACYIIYDNVKINRNGRATSNKVEYNKENISMMLELLNGKLDAIENAIESIKNNAELLNEKFEAEILRLDDKISNQYLKVADEIDSRTADRAEQHLRNMMNQVKIAPKLHAIMAKYLPRIKTDHILLGSFHNGTSSITGIPYYKYDITAEKFSSENDFDTELALMYKDVDVLRHNKLPITLLNKGMVHYVINKDDSSELSKVDDIIYRRLLGRNIKLFTLHIIRQNTDDPKIQGKPIGFIVCIKYNYDKIDFDELSSCAHEIENIYNEKN